MILPAYVFSYNYACLVGFFHYILSLEMGVIADQFYKERRFKYRPSKCIVTQRYYIVLYQQEYNQIWSTNYLLLNVMHVQNNLSLIWPCFFFFLMCHSLITIKLNFSLKPYVLQSGKDYSIKGKILIAELHLVPWSILLHWK